MVLLRGDLTEKLKLNLWLFSLSLSYAKEIGACVVLHTDELGKSLFSYLPYDEIYVSLEKIEAPHYFWAAGKIHAQLLEPLGSIHIDGDVFLKNLELRSKLSFTNSDLLIQSKEIMNDVYMNHINIFNFYNRAVPDFKYIFKTAFSYNCGLVGFYNESLKNEYIQSYKSLVSYCLKNKCFLNFMKQHSDSFVPDLIVEQLNLSSRVINGDFKAKVLLPNTETIQSDAIEMGYTHLLGKNKLDKIEKVKERLHEVNPYIYNLTKRKIASL